MKFGLTSSCLLLLLSSGACRTTDRPMQASSAEAALLLEVSAAERASIAAARETCDQANDAYAASRADHIKAGEAKTMAGEARNAAALKVDQAEAALARATASGTTDEVGIAKENLAKAKSEWEVEEAKVTLTGKQVDYADALVSLAKEHVDVTEASLELVKAKAVNTLDRPKSQLPDVSVFEASLRAAKGDENVARTKSEAAKTEVKVAKDNLTTHENVRAKL